MLVRYRQWMTGQVVQIIKVPEARTDVVLVRRLRDGKLSTKVTTLSNASVHELGEWQKREAAYLNALRKLNG